MLTLTFAVKAWPLIGQRWEFKHRERRLATMSVQDTSRRATTPPPLKPEAKPRPHIPPKPSPQCTSPPLGERGSFLRLSGGKVKSIVSKFSKNDSMEAEEQPTNGAAEPKAVKRFKRPPTVKPKPNRASLQLQLGGEKAPPLPVKRSRTLKRQNEIEGEADSIGVEGGRSGRVGWRHYSLCPFLYIYFVAIVCHDCHPNKKYKVKFHLYDLCNW